MKKKLLHGISWVDAKKYFFKNDIVVLPVGSTEQHGPHNPLGTDHLIAKALAEESVKRTGIVCLPVIPFGVSSHHRQFWGTVFVQPKVFREYVRDVCLSLKYHGVKKIIIVNGHGGNTSSLSEVARELRNQGMLVSVFQWWNTTGELLPKIFGSDERGHAGSEETSINLFLYPKLVKMDKALNEKPKEPIPKVSGVVGWGSDTIDHTASGVFGDATAASAEKGKKAYKVVVDELTRLIEIIKGIKAEDLVSKPLV